MRFSVRARAQNALFRRLRFSSPAQTLSHLTQRRILHRPPYGKPHSVPGNSRKSTLCTGDATSTWPKGAFWTGGVTEKRTLRVGLTKGRTLHASGGCAESPFSPICVHSFAPHPLAQVAPPLAWRLRRGVNPHNPPKSRLLRSVQSAPFCEALVQKKARAGPVPARAIKHLPVSLQRRS